ncbi:MAG: hypothetical protein VX642_01955, partial [Bdellovibrionota bacterium]|nr:hypothetical protein [Bdellovibrionota bacterium]
MKSLLVFAHKAEASSFIRELQLKRDNSYSGELYLSEEISLLICGEGPMRSSAKLSKAIHHLQLKNIELIINMGIAGSLNDKLEINKIYDFSVVLAEASFGKPEFKGFESLQRDSKNYLITALDRVKTAAYREQLSQFAEAVDREAWGLAFVCDEYNIPFSCYKLISDVAGPETSCFDVKEKAKFYSESLLEFYFSHISKQSLPQKPEENESFENETLKKNFFFSSTQKKSFEKLSLSLRKMNPSLFSEILSSENLDEICQEFKRPKDR